MGEFIANGLGETLEWEGYVQVETLGRIRDYFNDLSDMMRDQAEWDYIVASVVGTGAGAWAGAQVCAPTLPLYPLCVAATSVVGLLGGVGYEFSVDSWREIYSDFAEYLDKALNAESNEGKEVLHVQIDQVPASPDMRPGVSQSPEIQIEGRSFSLVIYWWVFPDFMRDFVTGAKFVP